MSDQAVLEASSEGQRLGEGDFPESLDRLNWTAVLWGGLWALEYAAWGWVLLLTAIIVVNVVLAVWSQNAGAPPVAPVLISVVGRIVWYAAVITLAYRANRHVWNHERARVVRESDQSVPRPAHSVETYLQTQRTWAWVGLAAVAFTTVFGLKTAWHAGTLVQQIAGDVALVVILTGLFAYERIRCVRSS